MGTTRICSSCGDSVSGTLDHCPKDGTPFFSEEVMSRVGMVIKDHEIQGVIGEGGMGVVYRAQHVVIEKPVAIKVLHDHFAKQKEMVEQFIIEAKAASRIRHPNVIDVTDFGTTPEGLVFLVMEYLDGESLQDRLARVHRLPIFDAVNIVKQVARGLGAAHELGIIHRDLKPANIFLSEREGRRRVVRRTGGELGAQFTIEPEQKFDLVKLLDFGVAKFMDLGPSAATRAGVLCGTPHYLSPEQAQEQPASERSDIYALGTVFYEMITGSVPFDGSSMFEILKGHVAGDLTPPSLRAPHAGIGATVDAALARCLEKDPARRFASTDELCDALDQCLDDRAFLRDAHRLPGIRESGLDLSEGGVDARRGMAAVEEGFSEVEGERELADIPDLDERPDRRRRARVSQDTTRIPRHNTALRVTILAVLLAGAVGGALWAMRGGSGAKTDQASGAAPAAVAAAAPPPSAGAATSSPGLAAARPGSPAAASGQAPSPSATKPTAVSEPALAAGQRNAAGKAAALTERAPVLAQARAPDRVPDRAEDRAGQARSRGAPAAGMRGRTRALPMPVVAPEPPIPVAAVPVAAEAPPPAPPPPVQPAPPPAPAVDVDALLREAQQAWSRKYYAVAIDKARAVLKAAPGRHEAYQIIAVCSCAVGAAADAQEAVSHLDAHKHKLVQSLCRSYGVTLE
jgi:serine/threonine protein kinase